MVNWLFCCSFSLEICFGLVCEICFLITKSHIDESITGPMTLQHMDWEPPTFRLVTKRNHSCCELEFLAQTFCISTKNLLNLIVRLILQLMDLKWGQSLHGSVLLDLYTLHMLHSFPSWGLSRKYWNTGKKNKKLTKVHTMYEIYKPVSLSRSPLVIIPI